MPIFKKGGTPWNKGLTKETDEKVARVAELNTGSKRTEEQKNNISKSLKKEKIDWQCPVCKKWFKFHKSECKNRKSCSYKCGGEAISKRMKEARADPNSAYNSDEYIEARKNYKPTKEAKEKRKKTDSLPKTKIKRSRACKKAHKRPEVKAKMAINGQKTKERWADPDSIYNNFKYRVKCKKRQKIVNNRPEKIAKFLKTMALPEIKEGHRESLRRVWQNTEFKKEMLKKMAKAKNIKPNNLEQFYDKLTPDIIRYVGDGQFFITTKKQTHNPDFKISGQNKIIEIFGDYYHNIMKVDNGELPDVPEEWIEEYAKVGWDCIIFWEHEVYNETEQVLKKTLKFIEDRRV